MGAWSTRGPDPHGGPVCMEAGGSVPLVWSCVLSHRPFD